MSKNYEHIFAISFSVQSNNCCANENSHVTAQELYAGLMRRIANLMESPEYEIIEACGCPEETLVLHEEPLDDPNAVCDCGDCDLCT
jgi:hypothetical protein